MGYTHYWSIDQTNVTPEKFLEVVKDTKKIIKASGVKITREYDSKEKPEFGEGYIRFNGYGDAGYETFVLDFNSHGTFCKTGRAEYDVVVAATLLRCSVLLGDAFQVSSDGTIPTEPEWEAAIKLYNSLFDHAEFTENDEFKAEVVA